MPAIVRLLLIIVLILLIVGMLPMWPYATNWGWYPSGGLGLLLILVVVLVVATNGRGGKL